LTRPDDTFTDQFRTGDDPLTGVVYYLLKMPQQLWFIAQVADALVSMTLERNWQQGGSVSIDDAIQAATDMQEAFKPMVGTIFLTAWATVPDGYLVVDGSTYARTDYPILDRVIDPVFHVDADNFTVPDLRNRVPIGTGDLYAIGDTGGEAAHTLDVSEMPSHSHTDTGHSHTTESSSLSAAEIPVVPVPTAIVGIGVTGSASANLTSAGGDGAHNNLQPYLATNYVIIAG